MLRVLQLASAEPGTNLGVSGPVPRLLPPGCRAEKGKG